MLVHTYRITFTVVSDPESDDMDCEELGNAEVDLKVVILLYCVL